MKASWPGEPLDESEKQTTSADARPPAVEVLSAEKVFSNGMRVLGADRSCRSPTASS